MSEVENQVLSCMKEATGGGGAGGGGRGRGGGPDWCCGLSGEVLQC